ARYLVAIGRAVDGPEHTDGRRLVGTASETRQHERQARRFALFVVYENRVFADIGDVDDLGEALTGEHHALFEVGTEANGLTVLQGNEMRRPRFFRRDLLEGAVVEDVAVLVDLDERRTAVIVRAAERLHHVLAVHVVRASHERGLRAQRQADG